MKKVLLINGSPRAEESGSYRAAREFLAGYVEASDAQAREVHLRRERVAPCTGCYTCWRATPGVCVQKDAMDGALLNDFAEADLVVLSTPVYHYGMSALLKAFFERTLPLNYPYMVKKGDLYVHPRRLAVNPERRFVAFATAGFPDEDNFRALGVHLRKLLGDSLAGEFHIPEGELYRVPELADLVKPRLEALRKAGAAFARDGVLPPDAAGATAPLVDADAFAALANASWSVPGEAPPTEAQLAGREPYNAFSAAGGAVPPPAPDGEGLAYLKRMAVFFDSAAAGNLEAGLGFAFSDSGERCVLRISGGACRADCLGAGEEPTVLVATALADWKRIGSGELDGQEALMKGLYRVEGDFSAFMRLSALFGRGGSSSSAAAADAAAGKAAPAKKRSLMALAFAPWYFGWWLGGASPWLGQLLPLVLALGYLAWRERRGEATWFERGSVLAFAFLSGAAFLSPAFFGERWNALTNAAIALVWAASLLYRRPLTADYSGRDYGPEVAKGVVFKRVNTILTAFWAAIFALQALVGLLPTGLSQGTLALVSGIALIPAGIFTARFPKLYTARLAGRGK